MYSELGLEKLHQHREPSESHANSQGKDAVTHNTSIDGDGFLVHPSKCSCLKLLTSHSGSSIERKTTSELQLPRVCKRFQSSFNVFSFWFELKNAGRCKFELKTPTYQSDIDTYTHLQVSAAVIRQYWHRKLLCRIAIPVLSNYTRLHSNPAQIPIFLQTQIRI